MSSTALLIVYCLLILMASLLGGWVPMMIRLTHSRIQLAVSLIAGFMLGIALLHMLPDAMEGGQPPRTLLTWLLAGLLTMFFVERFFCFHHHDVPEITTLDTASTAAPPSTGDSDLHEHAANDHDHPDPHNAHDSRFHLEHSTHELTWSGAALGLTLHSIIGGVALAAGVAADEALGGDSRVAGLAVFLVILLHKPFDSMSLITLMSVGRWSNLSRHVINTLFALCIPLGVLAFYAGYGWIAQGARGIVGPALAFSAGTFLCISLSDLLPELQFHHHDRSKLSAALLIGLGLAWAIHIVEGHTIDQHHADHDPGMHNHAACQIQPPRVDQAVHVVLGIRDLQLVGRNRPTSTPRKSVENLPGGPPAADASPPVPPPSPPSPPPGRASPCPALKTSPPGKAHRIG